MTRIVGEMSKRGTVHRRHARGRGTVCGIRIYGERVTNGTARPLCRLCFDYRRLMDENARLRADLAEYKRIIQRWFQEDGSMVRRRR